MARMIQIRHVPDRLHRKLKARAAKVGMTLSDYLRSELEKIAERPTRAELFADRPHYGDELEPSPAEIVRGHREA